MLSLLKRWSFHRITNAFMGASLLLLAALYSVPSESSVGLDRATSGVLSITNLSVLFALCGAGLIVRHWRPLPAILLTLPALALALFNSYFLFRVLFEALTTGAFSILIRPVWPPDFYLTALGLFWLCKVYEYFDLSDKRKRS